MVAKSAPKYTKKSIPFKDWIDQPGTHCKICGRNYITVVETGLSLIYAHRYGLLCESRKGI